TDHGERAAGRDSERQPAEHRRRSEPDRQVGDLEHAGHSSDDEPCGRRRARLGLGKRATTCRVVRWRGDLRWRGFRDHVERSVATDSHVTIWMECGINDSIFHKLDYEMP